MDSVQAAAENFTGSNCVGCISVLHRILCRKRLHGSVCRSLRERRRFSSSVPVPTGHGSFSVLP